ncbi:MAG: hypothetical protein J6A67_03980, partial [Clostridia bacterium]|nr:hypothetical protein [Clostridia bacterium]
LQKTMKNQAFHEVSLRLLLRKIHLPLGKGGFAQLELICKSSLQTRICRGGNMVVLLISCFLYAFTKGYKKGIIFLHCFGGVEDEP